MRLNGLKICGISDPETALFCAQQGAGAVGVVFFAKSPRNVTADQAAGILAPLPEDVARVGVFVNMPADQILRTAETAGLTTVQLHGDESNEAICRVLNSGYRVIKVLKSTGERLLNDAMILPPACGIMIELSQGELPGGNGTFWDWSLAAVLSGRFDYALAGGLNAANLRKAQCESGAVALDLSSAAESSPGVKDCAKIEEICLQAGTLNLNRVFWR